MFFGAIGWHLYRIATLRPKFDKLSDTSSTVGTFFFVYILAGMVRWSALGDGRAVGTFLGLLWLAIVFWSLCKTSQRSSALVVSMFGASAAIDILACLMDMSGLYGSGARRYFLIYELTLYAVCAWRFSREPESVQRCRVA